MAFILTLQPEEPWDFRQMLTIGQVETDTFFWKQAMLLSSFCTGMQMSLPVIVLSQEAVMDVLEIALTIA